MSTALITGASAGLGRDMAVELANRGYDLVLVARREERLHELAKTLPTQTRVVALDLSKDGAATSLFDAVRDEPITLLINNAGLGLFGEFAETDLSRETDMIALNILSHHTLTKLFLQRFLEQNEGGILNVSSSAAFMPGGPFLSTYYATKAYVYSLTQGIQQELKKNHTRVWMSVLCPGPVKTEFEAAAGLLGAPSGMDAQKVAAIAVREFLNKKRVIVPGVTTKLGRFLVRFVPDSLLLYFGERYQSKRKERRQ